MSADTNRANHFTTSQAAVEIGVLPDTLRSWMKKGWLDTIWSRDEVGKWTYFNAEDVVLLRLVKEFSKVMPVPEAAECVGGCTGPISIFLDEAEGEGREKYRFIGVQLITHEGKTIYAPHYAESLEKFQSSGVFGYFIIDLAAIPMPTTPKEPAQ